MVSRISSLVIEWRGSSAGRTTVGRYSVRSCGRRDNASRADHDVAVVQHRRLAGRDTVGRFVETRVEAAGPPLHRRRHGRRPVAELDVRAIDLREQPPGRPDACPRKRLAWPDHDGVPARDGAHGVDRRPGRHAEPLPLPRREPPEPAVATDDAAVLVLDVALFRREPVPAEERAVVVAPEEARLLALRPASGRKACALGLSSSVVLRLVAEREPDSAEDPRIESRQHVRLILRRVGAPGEQQLPVPLDDPGVVARRQARGRPGRWGSTRGGGVTRRAFGPARRRATALSTPPLIATATRSESRRARKMGPIALASASTASSSPPTAAASSSVRPSSGRSSPSASALTIRSRSTARRTSRRSPGRGASPTTSITRPR